MWKFETIATKIMFDNFGGRAFQPAAPNLWNFMPANICNMENLNSFKKAFIENFLISSGL